MNTIYLLVRAIHVTAAVLWTGGAVFTALLMTPAAADLGADEPRFAAALRKRGIAAYFPAVAGIALLTGIWLYWRFTAGFSAEVSRSSAGMAFGLGGLCGLAAFVVGGPILSVSLAKSIRLSGEAASLPAGPDRTARLAEADALRRRARTAGVIVTVLLLATTVIMTLARDL